MPPKANCYYSSTSSPVKANLPDETTLRRIVSLHSNDGAIKYRFFYLEHTVYIA
jgi:hypothetical protein